MCLYVCTIVSVEGIMPQRDSMQFSGTRCNSIGLNALLAGRFLEDPQIYRNLVDYMIWVRLCFAMQFESQSTAASWHF